MTNASILSTAKNLEKALEESKEHATTVVEIWKNRGDIDEAKRTIKRHNESCLKTNDILSTLFIICCSNYSDKMSNLLDEYQHRNVYELMLSEIDFDLDLM